MDSRNYRFPRTFRLDDFVFNFFDLGNAKAMFFELAGAGLLEPVVKEKIHLQAKGKLLPGHRKLRPDLTTGAKTKNFFAMVKIALTGT